MSDAVMVAIIGLVGTVFSATTAAMATILTKRIGQPNGGGSLSAQLDELKQMLLQHIEDDNIRFARLLGRSDK
jgi:hypothetical protein